MTNLQKFRKIDNLLFLEQNFMIVLMVDLVSLYLLRKHKQSVSLFHTQFVLDLLFFFKVVPG